MASIKKQSMKKTIDMALLIISLHFPFYFSHRVPTILDMV